MPGRRLGVTNARDGEHVIKPSRPTISSGAITMTASLDCTSPHTVSSLCLTVTGLGSLYMPRVPLVPYRSGRVSDHPCGWNCPLGYRGVVSEAGILGVTAF